MYCKLAFYVEKQYYLLFDFLLDSTYFSWCIMYVNSLYSIVVSNMSFYVHKLHKYDMKELPPFSLLEMTVMQMIYVGPR